MYAHTWGTAIDGLEGIIIKVEVDISRGLPCFEIVGLPNAFVKEAKERVRAAIQNTGFEFPMRRIIVNLAPADRRKNSSGLDLPIAIGILEASGQLKGNKKARLRRLESTMFMGELTLRGEVSPIQGVLAMSLAMKKTELDTLVVDERNAKEGRLGFSKEVVPVTTLQEAVQWVLSGFQREATEPEPEKTTPIQQCGDFSEVAGQVVAKKALEIAAAGGHHILLTGEPGSGKTMLIQRLPSILPPLTREEQLEVSRIYSIVGLLPSDGLLQERPLRMPHHTSTVVSLAGGGAQPRPGELTLSHTGVLFLDEAPEFKKQVLEVLRQPLEEGYIRISRLHKQYTFPCQFLLALAMNPCPCGWYGSQHGKECECTLTEIQRYQHKLSGPLLDRIDLVIPVSRPTFEEMKTPSQESSASIRERVMQARERQQARCQAFGYERTIYNGGLPHKDLVAICRLTADAEDMLAHIFKTMEITMRSYDRLIRVARTIADLAGDDCVDVSAVAEAMSYRHQWA